MDGAAGGQRAHQIDLETGDFRLVAVDGAGSLHPEETFSPFFWAFQIDEGASGRDFGGRDDEEAGAEFDEEQGRLIAIKLPTPSAAAAFPRSILVEDFQPAAFRTSVQLVLFQGSSLRLV